MCSGGSTPAPVTPAPAPAPPEPAPLETSLTEARRKQCEELYGTTDGSANTRRDDSSSGANFGGGTKGGRNGRVQSSAGTGLRM